MRVGMATIILRDIPKDPITMQADWEEVAAQVDPTGTDPNATPVEVIPESEWTEGMREVFDYTQGVARRLIGKPLSTSAAISDDGPGTAVTFAPMAWAAATSSAPGS